MEDWRTLLYPLGFLPACIFGARFLLQWILSEKAQQSIVPKSFWHLSLLGNLLMMFHSFIQVQIHVCLVQALNAVIAWRNLNLMQSKKTPLSFHTVLAILVGVTFLTLCAFALQGYFFHLERVWFRVPIAPWHNGNATVPLLWHVIGSLGYILFSSRFYIQWWFAEKAQKSTLPLSFWWLSLGGALLSLAYFIDIGDSVNLIGPLLGVVPYIRNLMLLHKAKKAT